MYDNGEELYYGIRLYKNVYSDQTGKKVNKKGQSFLNRNYKTSRVYLATSLIGAYDIQNNFNSHDGKKYIILEIDTDKLKGSFFNDDLYLHGIYTESSIPKKCNC